jgi:pyroglutamyl-peptidase
LDQDSFIDLLSEVKRLGEPIHMVEMLDREGLVTKGKPIDEHVETQSTKKILFFVTGFGPFQNSKENPTTTITNRLIAYLEQREEENDAFPKLAALTMTLVIETSAGAARKELDRLYDDHVEGLSADQTVVFLHLGVNFKSKCFQLEKCAYNDATFRIPDERGYQPRNKAIVDTIAYQQCFSTDLDTTSLKRQLDGKGLGLPIELSMDPGRFVCNYTYFYSLSKIQKVGNRSHSLFVHVPPFQVIGEEEQLHLVVTLMEAIYNQIP